MRRNVIALMLFAAVVVAHSRAPRAATVATRVVSETNGEIVVEVIDQTNALTSPVGKFFVAIPPQGTYNVSFDPGGAALLGDTTAAPGWFRAEVRDLTAAALDTVEVSVPFAFRASRILYIEVNLFFLSGSSVMAATDPRVTVTYTPAAHIHDRASADPLLRELVVNRDVFPYEPVSGGPDPWFSLSPNWVKIPISQRGMYRLTVADLQPLGVDLTAIDDPGSLRLYTSGAQQQSQQFTDTLATWRRGRVMREVPILVDTGTNNDIDASSEGIVFYGLGAEDWSDYYDPAARDSTYYRHERAKLNFYYLTWDGALPGTPRRMATLDASPGAGPDRTTYRHREYREQDRIRKHDYRGDGWVWLDVNITSTITLGSVTVQDLVASVPQVFRTVALSEQAATFNPNHLVRVDNTAGGSTRLIGQYAWTGRQSTYESGIPVRIEGSFLSEGGNTVKITKPNVVDDVIFAWYSLWYERRLDAVGDRLAFTAPDTTGTASFAVSGFGSGSGQIDAYDVTDPWGPVRLTGFAVASQGGGRSVRLGSTFAGAHRHFEVTSRIGYRRAQNVVSYQPADLRAASTSANMVIVTERTLRAGAELLAAHRRSSVPGYSNPVVDVVDINDIYDNFSGGLPDPWGLRNYLKFLHDNYPSPTGSPALGYVLFFGDATWDFRNNASAEPDRVPTVLRLITRRSYTFTTDEVLGHFDSNDLLPGGGRLNVAIGRLPVQTPTEATDAAAKVIAYETQAPRDSWRKEIIMVADDEVSSTEGRCETEFTSQSETIVYQDVAPYVESKKIYLTEYERVGGVKPTSRFALLDAWNSGALSINYIGHGSSRQMADEQVFVDTDVNLLNNGLRLPILTALSCTIGDYANPTARSLSEKLIFRNEGGAIATLTASRESFVGENLYLNRAVYEHLMPRALGTGVTGIGVAHLVAKTASLLDANSNADQEENNWKYNLLADPAMRLGVPAAEVRLYTGEADTLVAGLRKVLRGGVYRDGVLDTGFNGTVQVSVREPVVFREYLADDPRACPAPETVRYRVPGGVLFSGTADVSGGEFEVNFRVPRLMPTGPLAFVTAYASDFNFDAAVTEDSLLAVVAPTLADSTELRARDGAPRVDLRFKSGLETVKPGETLQAVVRDADGINILDTTNEGRQAILIDDLPVPIEVNEFFTYDHGGTDTSGVLLYPLPDLDTGRHRLIYKVSDNFGLTRLDTLMFDVTDPADYYAEAVLNYPNPFKTSTEFMFRISNRAEIRLDVYTVSGKRIRRLEAVRDGGEVWIPWDGRDEVGDDIANGTYLYVARVAFTDVDRPPLVLRGKVSKIR